ncbi:hypothetical protein SRABI128_00739 [Microbacterium sp. Bi128]|nr:hypothetical protein SRABI128_00739 [Microbacterium sp. Bi128]
MPAFGDLVAPPDPRTRPGEVPDAEGGALQPLRARDRDAEDVGLELAQQVVPRGSPVDLEEGDRDAVTPQVVDVVARLERHRLDPGADHVGSRGLEGQPDDAAAGVAVPVRVEQSRERRHEVHTAAVGHALGESLARGGPRQDAEPVAQPLDRLPAVEHHSLGLVRDVVVEPPRHAATHAGQGPRAGTDVDGEDARGAEGVLGAAGLEARLAVQARLLVAEDRQDRHRPVLGAGEDPRSHVAEPRVGGDDLGEQADRDVQDAAELVVPLRPGERHQARAGRGPGLGPVGGAPGEVPQQPRLGSADGQLAALGALPGARDVPQEPRDLGRREEGVVAHPGAGPELVVQTARRPLPDDVVGLLRHPHDGVVDGGAGAAVPHHDRLAVGGHPHRAHLGPVHPGARERPQDRGARRVPQVERIELDPALVREDRVDLRRRLSDDGALRVDEHGARAAGALVQGQDVTRGGRHGRSVRPAGLRGRAHGGGRASGGNRRSRPRAGRHPTPVRRPRCRPRARDRARRASARRRAGGDGRRRR